MQRQVRPVLDPPQLVSQRCFSPLPSCARHGHGGPLVHPRACAFRPLPLTLCEVDALPRQTPPPPWAFAARCRAEAKGEGDVATLAWFLTRLHAYHQNLLDPTDVVDVGLERSPSINTKPFPGRVSTAQGRSPISTATTRPLSPLPVSPRALPCPSPLLPALSLLPRPLPCPSPLALCHPPLQSPTGRGSPSMSRLASAGSIRLDWSVLDDIDEPQRSEVRAGMEALQSIRREDIDRVRALRAPSDKITQLLEAIAAVGEQARRHR